MSQQSDIAALKVLIGYLIGTLAQQQGSEAKARAFMNFMRQNSRDSVLETKKAFVTPEEHQFIDEIASSIDSILENLHFGETTKR